MCNFFKNLVNFYLVMSDQSESHPLAKRVKVNEFQAAEKLNVQQEDDEYYMRLALQVSKSALTIGEVPVGCVIVLRMGGQGTDYRDSVVISHGANQVNATRDATRHAEIVAIDRMLTGGQSSDQQRLPAAALASSAHGKIPAALLSEESRESLFQDKWINVPEDPSHWKNSYGWGSKRTYTIDTFANCDLYVTCEPCIMVSV
jgi:tRNA(Arg) A34 adenosine deaminase TadA